MIGLHCCGDLTPSMLRIFSNSEEVRGLVVVGCCYNHLSHPQRSYGKRNINFYDADGCRDQI